MKELDITRARTAFAAGNITALRKLMVAAFPDDPEVGQARELIEMALGKRMRAPDMNAETEIFFDSIECTRRIAASGGAEPAQSRIEIGPNLDFIANLDGISGWTIAQCLNYLATSTLRPSRRAAVVGTMRDDGIYVLEWIAYYLTLGFEHIFIYTNDNSDGSDKLLQLLADARIITLIESKTSRKVPPEVKAYEHSIQLLHALRAFEWVLYVDSDEFFVPAPRFDNSVAKLITALEERFPEQLPSCVCYAWRWYVSGMAFERAPGLLIERFQHARPHALTKAFVRLEDVVSMRYEHYPEVKKGGFLVDSAFETVTNVDEMWSKWEPQYEGGWLNHYWPKSFEEFAIKKARGQTLNLEVNSYDRPFSLFFAWNGYESKDNHVPMDPLVCERVKSKVQELRRIEGVGSIADGIDREFPALLDHYYGDKARLRSVYEEHKCEPKSL
jgi:hypothetical protein